MGSLSPLNLGNGRRECGRLVHLRRWGREILELPLIISQGETITGKTAQVDTLSVRHGLVAWWLTSYITE